MSRWTDEFLQSMRQEMDPLADKAVEALFTGGGLAAVKSFHGDLIDDDGKPLPGLPDAMVHYLNETSKPPSDWKIDEKKLALAERIMNSHGPVTYMVLGCASLPECYVDWRGMPVLFLTQKLNTEVKRRVIETCLYVASVLSTGGFSPTGHGLDATRKVRLMHAATRYLVLNSTDERLAAGLPGRVAEVFANHGWEESMGMPINQEDLGYTLQTFAWVMVRGMESMGLKLETEERDAIIHCWNVAGHYLGVDHRLMPNDAAEAEQLFNQMKARLAGPSPEGESMMAALLTFVDEYLIEKLFDEETDDHYKPMPEMLVRYLVGDETAGMLGIEQPTEEDLRRGRIWLTVFKGIVKIREARFDAFPFMRKISDKIFEKISLGRWGRLAGSEAFQIPDDLAKNWAVVEMPDNE